MRYIAQPYTNLVYNSILSDYDYIFFHLLFFIKMKLSIFSRLCLTLKRVMIRSPHRGIEILHWFKENCAVVESDRYRQILRIFGIESVLKKNGIVAFLIITINPLTSITHLSLHVRVSFFLLQLNHAVRVLQLFCTMWTGSHIWHFCASFHWINVIHSIHRFVS